MEQSDEAIMQAFQTGDENALGELFRRYKNRLLNFCYRITGNRADAEEVASDVFLALANRPQAYDTQRTFSTWIYTIARNKCVSCIRKKVRLGSFWVLSPKKQTYEQWEPADDNQNNESVQLEQKECAESVRRAIAKLPLEQREAIVLQQYEGLSYQQISEVLDCSLEKVKILIFRGKEQLRAELASFLKEAQS